MCTCVVGWVAVRRQYRISSTRPPHTVHSHLAPYVRCVQGCCLEISEAMPFQGPHAPHVPVAPLHAAQSRMEVALPARPPPSAYCPTCAWKSAHDSHRSAALQLRTRCSLPCREEEATRHEREGGEVRGVRGMVCVHGCGRGGVGGHMAWLHSCAAGGWVGSASDAARHGTWHGCGCVLLADALGHAQYTTPHSTVQAQ